MSLGGGSRAAVRRALACSLQWGRAPRAMIKQHMEKPQSRVRAQQCSRQWVNAPGRREDRHGVVRNNGGACEWETSDVRADAASIPTGREPNEPLRNPSNGPGCFVSQLRRQATSSRACMCGNSMPFHWHDSRSWRRRLSTGLELANSACDTIETFLPRT